MVQSADQLLVGRIIRVPDMTLVLLCRPVLIVIVWPNRHLGTDSECMFSFLSVTSSFGGSQSDKNINYIHDLC